MQEKYHSWFWDKIVESIKIEPKKGNEGIFHGNYVTLNNFEDTDIKEWLLDSTVILGMDGTKNKGPGSGEWSFTIPKKIRSHLKSINLRITSIRIHEGLHTPKRYTDKNKEGKGEIYINDSPIDNNIKIQTKMPHGNDLGIHDVGPFPIINWIEENIDEYKIKLAVNCYALWGIDEISLEPLIERKILKTGWGLLIGAILSFIGGVIVQLLIS